MLGSLGIAGWLLAHHVRVTQDDGFYYFRIAQHVAGNAGSTFDGIHPTNGYHPLWLLSLVPVFWLSRSAASALVVGTLLQSVFLGLSAALVYRTARLSLPWLPAALGGVLWVLLVYRVSLGGTEFSLHALCVVTTAYLYLRDWVAEPPRTARAYGGLGLVLSATFLARLDTIVLAGLIGGSLAWREWRVGRKPRPGRWWLALVAPVVLTVLLYAGLNAWRFGDPLPVSSAVKREWSAYLLAQDPIYRAHGFLLAKIHQLAWPLGFGRGLYPLYVALGSFGICGLWLAGALATPSAPSSQLIRQTLGRWHPFVVYSLVGYLGYAWLYHGDLSGSTWYYVIQPWLVVMSAAVVAARLLEAPYPWPRHATMVGAAILLCAVLLAIPLSLTRWRDREMRGVVPRPLYDAARWVEANLPSDAVVGAWNAGTVGYLSGRRVVNLDGVVNSWAYFRTERHDLCEYWRAVGVTYLVDAFENGRALSVVPTHPAYARCAHRLALVWSDGRYGTPWRMEAYRVRMVSP